MTSVGHIYMIITPLDNSFCYIGSTFNRLHKRFEGHKKDYKCSYGKLSIHEYFDKYGIDNFKIIKIKSYNVIREHKKDFKHLHAYETLWISKTKNCVNKLIPFQPLKKEKHREYYENNKQKYKEYRDNNKEKSKEYRENNKEKSKEYRENNKEKKNEYDKEYHAKFKEKILERQKKYKSQNWYCSICDKNIKIGTKYKHFKTTKHKKHLSLISQT
jgi:hypothetical protein